MFYFSYPDTKSRNHSILGAQLYMHTCTKITDVNLSACAYRLFPENFALTIEDKSSRNSL